jgi:hypothetical protein
MVATPWDSSTSPSSVVEGGLSWDHLREVSASGLIEIGSHSYDHVADEGLSGGYDGYPGAYGGGYGGYSGYSVAGPAIVVPAPVIAPSIVIAPGSRGIRGRGPGRSYGRGPSGLHRGG